MRRLAVVVLLVQAILFAQPQPSSAQDEAADAREAGATAEELFRLAADRKFNALYDRIHPDAHAEVPRAAAVGAFEDIYAAAQAGRARVTGVEIGEWTWGVTGQRYPYAAAVHFEQPYVEDGQEQLLEDTMYLVESQGEWRWFFGSSRAFVDQVIEQYGSRGEPLTEGDLIVNVVTDLDTFYRDVLSYTEYTYTSPEVVLVAEGASTMSGCGRASTGFWGFYCPPDQTLYLDEALLDQAEQTADFAAAFVIGHEWAHHIQTGVGLQRSEAPDEWNELYSIELELMADCLTGAWALDVDTRGLLEADDVDEAVQFTIQYLGDPAYIDEYDPQAHGSADQRAQAFLSGYENGFLGCNISI